MDTGPRPCQGIRQSTDRLKPELREDVGDGIVGRPAPLHLVRDRFDLEDQNGLRFTGHCPTQARRDRSRVTTGCPYWARAIDALTASIRAKSRMPPAIGVNP